MQRAEKEPRDSNPTGAMLSADGWLRVMEAAKADDVLVISHLPLHRGPRQRTPAGFVARQSRGYQQLLQDPGYHGLAAGVRDRPSSVDTADGRLQGDVTACSPSIAQWAVAECLDDSADYQRWVGSTCSPISRGWRRIPQPWPSVCFGVGWPWLWAGRSGRMARAAPACLSLRTGTILTRLSVASRGR